MTGPKSSKLIQILAPDHLSSFLRLSVQPSDRSRPLRPDPSLLCFGSDPAKTSPPSDPSKSFPKRMFYLTSGPARSFFPQIFRDRRTRVACPLQSLPAAWLVFSDARRSASSLTRDRMDSRAPFPNGSGSPSATFLQRLASRAHHHIARSRPQSLMSPVFSVTSTQSRRLVFATR